MKWFLFAWKNVWRNSRRSMTTIMITATGSAAILIFSGYMLFTFESLSEMSARQYGNVIISHAKYFEGDEPVPMAYGLDDWRTIQKELKLQNGVKQVLPRIHFSGLISNGEKSMVFIGTGVDAEHEFDLQGSFLDVRQGELLDPEAEVPEVMLGVDLARSLQAVPGSVLTLLSTTSDGVLNGIDVQLVGMIATGIPEMDKRALTVSLHTAQELLITKSVSTLSVYLYQTDETDRARIKIQADYPTLGIKIWEDLAFFYHKVRDLYERIFGMMGVIILVVVLLSVANTMSMAVLERTREIGIMAAMGAPPYQILFNFISESMIIGIMGSALGILMAGGLTLILPFAEIMMPPPPGRNVAYPLILHFSIDVYVVVSVIIVLITIMGGFMAARKGVKKSIVEALAHV